MPAIVLHLMCQASFLEDTYEESVLFIGKLDSDDAVQPITVPPCHTVRSFLLRRSDQDTSWGHQNGADHDQVSELRWSCTSKPFRFA